MKIGIDARFWSHAGPGRYVKNLILNLEKIDQENKYTIFLDRTGLKDYKVRNPNFYKVGVSVPWYSLTEQLKLPSIFAREDLDLLHVPHYNIPIFYPGKLVITIHDLTIHHFSTARATTKLILIYKLKRLLYRFVFWLAIKRAKKVFVPTEFVKKDLLATYPWLDPEKILVAYESVGDEFKNAKWEMLNAKSVLEKYGVSKPYILYVGSMYPHKNLSSLIEAFKLVSEEDEDLSLVLVGKQDFFQERLREEVARAELSSKVIFPAFQAPSGYVPDEELLVFYREALLFVSPSLSEGFGLPLLEAMSVGIPVAASRTTSIPEVCGGAALYFDPENIKDITRKIKSLVKNPNLRDELVRKGYDNLNRFSWKHMAEETRKGYESS